MEVDRVIGCSGYFTVLLHLCSSGSTAGYVDCSVQLIKSTIITN